MNKWASVLIASAILSAAGPAKSEQPAGDMAALACDALVGMMMEQGVTTKCDVGIVEAGRFWIVQIVHAETPAQHAIALVLSGLAGWQNNQDERMVGVAIFDQFGVGPRVYEMPHIDLCLRNFRLDYQLRACFAQIEQGGQ